MSGNEKSRAELEAIFANGNRPTGQDFADLFESVSNKKDDVAPVIQLYLGKEMIGSGTMQLLASFILPPKATADTSVTILCSGASDFDLNISDTGRIWEALNISTSSLDLVVIPLVGTVPNIPTRLDIMIEAALGEAVQVESLLIEFK